MLAAPAGAATSHQRSPLVRTASTPLAHTGGMRSSSRARTLAGVEANTYVSTTGTDIGLCLQVTPCATITYAESQTSIGGTINVADGTYNQTANLTQPLNLVGASETKVIIDGSNIDEGAMGYYGVIGVDNTSGTAGTIAISDLTVTHPYVTATEFNNDQSPIDISNFDQTQTGDTVKVTHVTLGPSQDETDYEGIGYYSLEALSTNIVELDHARGLFEAYFAEGNGGPTTIAHDSAEKLAGWTYQGTYYPAVGVFGLSDTEGSLAVTANKDNFEDYNGWGIVGEAGYSGGNCSQNVCTGGLTIGTYDNYFDLLKAPASDGVAAIQAIAMANDSLTGNFNYSYGMVVRPDLTVSVVNQSGTLSVTDSHNNIKIKKS